ncbi:MAG TPA: non-homologous end-joining DNA ligase [Thermoanaerobaculia bacterium]|jgi:bifunctional non-homologous end joining protein LigD
MAPRDHDRVLFPETGFTKRDAIDFYTRIAKVMLPHLRARPLSFKRYPSTIRNESFWEKDAPSFTPAWVRTFPVPRREGGEPIHYVVANDAKTLKWIAGVGGIEIHPFLHRVPKIAEPTHVVFDLDPGPGADIIDCCEVALILREALDAEPFVKVSGSKGLQVYAPLRKKTTHEQSESIARLLAEELARRHPGKIVAKMTKSLRVKKVFIDWSQNADYKTTVAVYSLRAKRERPYVSMPMKWAEIEKSARDGDVERLEFSPAAALKRVAKLGDLFSGAVGAPPRRTAAAPGTSAGQGARRSTEIKPSSQSGRRLFVITKTETGNELWLEMRGRFKRWILRPDREGDEQLIAMPAGDFAIDPSYYRGEVPKAWRARVTLEDHGVYEIVEGSYQEERFAMYFNGRVLAGAWNLTKTGDGEEHRSWRLAPIR